MYTSFYKLDRKPFEILPDGSFLWRGENFKEVLSTLRHGILGNKGFLLVTGDAGVGKTSLIKALTNSFDSDVISAVIDDPTLDRIDFYNDIARNFGIDKKFTSKVQFLIQFSHFLHKADDDNKKVLLLVDECHLLNQEMLEELRLLSNIEKADAKLINIFFVGERSFNELLGQPKNRAVRQRLTLTTEIPRLTAHEVEDYIRHRMQAAGAEEKVFSARACQLVHQHSGGLPLEINRICDAALNLGANQEEYSVTPALVESALNKTGIYHDTEAIPVQSKEYDDQPDGEKDYSRFKLGDSPDSKITGFNLEADRKPVWLKLGFAALALIVVGAYFFKSSETPVAQIEPASEVVAQVEKEHPGKASMVSKSPAVNVLEENGDEINKLKVDELKSVILEKAYKEESPTETEKEVVHTVITENIEQKEQAKEVASGVGKKNLLPEVTAEVSTKPITPHVEAVSVAPDPDEDVVAEIIPKPEPEVQMVPLEPRKVLLPLQPNSLKLTKAGRRAFNTFVEKLLDYPKATILVKGFVSSQSNSAENIKLSKDRAFSVYKKMLDRGVDPEQIEMEGMGNREPIASNGTRAGRAKNRRVEILVIRDGLEE